jgi:hypothetical protein
MRTSKMPRRDRNRGVLVTRLGIVAVHGAHPARSSCPDRRRCCASTRTPATAPAPSRRWTWPMTLLARRSRAASSKDLTHHGASLGPAVVLGARRVASAPSRRRRPSASRQRAPGRPAARQPSRALRGSGLIPNYRQVMDGPAWSSSARWAAQAAVPGGPGKRRGPVRTAPSDPSDPCGTQPRGLGRGAGHPHACRP